MLLKLVLRLLVAWLPAGTAFAAAAPVSPQSQSPYGRGGGARQGSRYGAPAQGVTASDERFQGSVARTGTSDATVPLSLRRATELGLANNLGILLGREEVTAARGERLVELSRLLPNLTASGTFHRLRESLAPTGITLPGIPPVVGPFNYYDARIFLSQRVFDLEAIKRSRAAGHELAAARLSERDARDIVVSAVGAAYLQILTDCARVETVAAQVVTAKVVLANAVEMHRAGVNPGIDELRARVETLTRTQQLIVAENDLAKDQLSLLRLIGLPEGERIVLTDTDPFLAPPAGTTAELLERALRSRSDYRAREELLRAAEASRQAAHAQRLPTLDLDADYGLIGLTPSTLHGSYHIVGTLSFPIFEGGRVRGDVLQAAALARQRKDELDDLKGRIEFEVRSALLDVGSAAREVEVAVENVRLAELTLSQARERFSAGVTDNIEVVQAQQSVAAAQEGLLSSRYRHNLAKLMLTRALGISGREASEGW